MASGAATADLIRRSERWIERLLKRESASSLVVAVGLNLVFLAAAWITGVERPLLNVDFLFAGAILHKGRWGRIGAWALICIGLTYEIYRYVAGVYLFDLGQIFDTFGYVYAWPLGAVAKIIAILVATGLVLLMFGKLASRYRFPTMTLLVIGSVTFLADAANGAIRYSRAQGGQLTQPEHHLAYSSLGETMTLVSNYVQGGKQAGAKLNGVRSYETALSAKGREDVLVITAESLGVFKSPAEQLAFQRKIAEAIGVPGVQFSTETSNGVTIDGEMRVLCRTGFGAVDVSIAKVKQDCLPHVFDRAGYVTAATHAYFGDFYKRTERYPALGFSRVRFLRDGKDRRCSGAFESGCDDDVLRELLATPAAPGQWRFLYQMTIETHLPEPACAGAADPMDAYRCRHLAYFRKLGAAMKTVDRPMRVVIAGDHPPPFPRAKLRQRFRPHQVTYITFEVNPPRKR